MTEKVSFNFKQVNGKLTIDQSISQETVDPEDFCTKYEISFLNTRVEPNVPLAQDIECIRLLNCFFSIVKLDPIHVNIIPGKDELFILKFNNLDIPAIRHSTLIEIHAFPNIDGQNVLIFKKK